MRLTTYELPLAPAIDAYVRRVRALPGVQDWVQGALAEHDFRPFEEPYRSALRPAERRTSKSRSTAALGWARPAQCRGCGASAAAVRLALLEFVSRKNPEESMRSALHRCVEAARHHVTAQALPLRHERISGVHGGRRGARPSLGRAVHDRDWVVVGATPEQMSARGFLPVGRDFPVFLHPETHEEYALARTERKSGLGYRVSSCRRRPMSRWSRIWPGAT